MRPLFLHAKRGMAVLAGTLLAVLLATPVIRAATEPAASVQLDDPAVFQKAVARGAAALPEAEAALRGPRPDLGVRLLGVLRLPAAVPLLQPLATDKDGELRALVAWALGEIGGTAGAPTLLSLAADPYAPVREAALPAVAKLGGAEAEAVLKQAVADADNRVRLAAVRAIGQSGRPDGAGLLTPLLDYRIEMRATPSDAPGKEPTTAAVIVWREADQPVRLAVIQALGALQAVDALPALIQAMEREDSYNRLAIIRVIHSLGERAAGVCLGRIVPMAYDREAFARHLPLLVNNGTLAVIAGQLGDDRCVPYLLDVLKLPREKLGDDKDLTELYIQAVELLGRYRVERAARPLAELLKQSQVSQLTDALQATLKAIGHAAARPLARNLDNWQMAPVFLALLREKELRTAAARDAIVGYLNHESDEVRLEATDTLGCYLFEGILEEYDMTLLEAMYLDPNPEVRARCEYWREKIRRRMNGKTDP